MGKLAPVENPSSDLLDARGDGAIVRIYMIILLRD